MYSELYMIAYFLPSDIINKINIEVLCLKERIRIKDELQEKLDKNTQNLRN